MKLYRKDTRWVVAGLVVLAMAVSLGVYASPRARAISDPVVEKLSDGTDAIESELGAPGVKYSGYVAYATGKSAKFTRSAAIQAAREFAGGLDAGASSVSAHHVLLASRNAPGGARLGSPGSPRSGFKTQGQSAWMVTFKGATRPPLVSMPVPDDPPGAPIQGNGPSAGNLLVLLDAETGEYIEMISLPASLPVK